MLGILVLLVGFSRNFLGVHTPQDVLVGIVAGTLVMFLTVKLMQWIDLHPEKDLLVICIGVGYCTAFLTGWILERRFVKFSTDISMKKRFTRLAVGLLSYYVVSLIFVPLIKDGISGAPGTFISCYLQIFYVSFIFPWLIKRFEKSEA